MISRRQALATAAATIFLPAVASGKEQAAPPSAPCTPIAPRTRGRGLMNFQAPWHFDTSDTGTVGINQWTQRIGGKFAAIQFGQFWVESSGRHTPFYKANVDAIWNYGAVPVINWSPWKQGGGAEQPAFSCERILKGDWNSLIDAYADGAKAWAKDGRWLVIRYAHEMNMTSNQFPWQPNRAGNSPAQFVAAWRYVVKRFAARGVTSAMVKWFWCPGQRSSTHPIALKDFWPGNDVVQIVGADCYNFGSPTLTLAQSFRGTTWGAPHYIYDTYGDIMAIGGARDLPFWIGETGTVATADGVGRAMWWQQAVDELDKAMPTCTCVLWYDDKHIWNSDRHLPVTISGDLTHEAAFVRANQHPLMHGDRALVAG
jgi:Glycosyl hydrolase family 26